MVGQKLPKQIVSTPITQSLLNQDQTSQVQFSKSEFKVAIMEKSRRPVKSMNPRRNLPGKQTVEQEPFNNTQKSRSINQPSKSLFSPPRTTPPPNHQVCILGIVYPSILSYRTFKNKKMTYPSTLAANTRLCNRKGGIKVPIARPLLIPRPQTTRIQILISTPLILIPIPPYGPATPQSNPQILTRFMVEV